ncbi:retrotransposon protein, putative, ty1-copia subclass [Tanacetum coccineum]
MTHELHRQFENYTPYEMPQELKSMFEKQAGVERFDLIQTFHACKQEEGKPIGSNVGIDLGMANTSDFAGFAATPQVMAIQSGRIQRANKKSLNAKRKGKGKGKGNDKSYIPKPNNKKNLNVLLKEHVAKDDPSPLAKRLSHSTSLPLRMNLLKHKHEVFETFKVLKNEVENQLRKTIKVLRSDRGGEHISQEFKDYLKSCGIVQQLTPPYTPQYNGVSEMRNRTLLDVTQECQCGGQGELEKFKMKVHHPSENTIKIPMEVEGFEPPQKEEAPVRRSERPHRAPNRLCLNVEVEKHRWDNSKRGYIPMQERLDLNKTQGASTPRKGERMLNLPYASAEILKLNLELIAIAMLDLRPIEMK